MPSSWPSNWVNTQFQNSRKRSQSQPGRSRGCRNRLRGPVKVDLGAGAARAGGAGAPEVVVLAQAEMWSSATPRLFQISMVSSSSSNTVKYSFSSGRLELLGDELEGPSASLLLGDAAKGEVAEHLEERQVTAVLADAVDVVGADALLAGDRADLLHGLLALVVLLKLVHTGVGKQQRGVVGNKGRRRIELKTALLKEVEELGSRSRP